MKVKMLQTKQGSNDGINTLTFIAGQTYECPATISKYLADAWIARNIAEIVKDIDTKIVTPEEKKRGFTAKSIGEEWGPPPKQNKK